MRTTKAGVKEPMGERDWQHPAHHGGNIKPPKIFDNIVTGCLTDKKIDRYSSSGFYSNRRYYRSEAKKFQKARDIFKKPKTKKLVYNLETQELEEREF